MPFSLSEACIVATEQKLGVVLPEAYRRRMLASSGGAIPTPPDEWELHPIFDSSDRKRIKRTTNDIIRETKAASGWTDWPERAIAIGANGAGDRLVLLRCADGSPACEPMVYWWDHETGQLHSVGAVDVLFVAAN